MSNRSHDQSSGTFTGWVEAIGRVSWVYWGSAFALALAAELLSLRRKPKDAASWSTYRAGDLGLDPFRLADDEVTARVRLCTAVDLLMVGLWISRPSHLGVCIL